MTEINLDHCILFLAKKILRDLSSANLLLLPVFEYSIPQLVKRETRAYRYFGLDFWLGIVSFY